MNNSPDPAAYRIVGYGAQAWNRRRQAIGTPYTEAEARARHEAGEPYEVLLTAAPGDAVQLPVAKLTLNEWGVSVSFHRHDIDWGDVAHVWHPGDDGRLRPVQVDRRPGNKRAVPQEAMVYEFLKLEVDPARWVRMTTSGSERLGEQRVDLDAVAADHPEFGRYEAFLDVGLGQRLWPGLPDLEWMGPENPVPS